MEDYYYHWHKPDRHLKIEIEYYNYKGINRGTFTNKDIIELIAESNAPANKISGYAISQTCAIKFMSYIPFQAGEYFKILIYPEELESSKLDRSFKDIPIMYVRDCEYDEYYKTTTVHCVDLFEQTRTMPFAELGMKLTAPYTFKDFILEFERAIVEKFNVVSDIDIDTVHGHFNESLLNATYKDGININGDEKLFDIMNKLAEAINGYITLSYSYGRTVFHLRTFRRVWGRYNKPDQYFNGTFKKLNMQVTEVTIGNSLGDTYTGVYDGEGNVVDYDKPIHIFVRDNPFLDNLESGQEEIAAEYARLYHNWAHPYYTLDAGTIVLRGDEINSDLGYVQVIETKDRNRARINMPGIYRKLTFDGGLRVEFHWDYVDQPNETFANPPRISESISNTTAKVDKVNKKIELVVSDIEQTNTKIDENISRIDQDSKSISASVEQVQKNLAATSDDLNGSIGQLTERVNATMTKDQVKIEIEKELQKGTDTVTTGTGFTFNEDGLTVSKKNNVMSTQITENGMYISESGNTVLSANNVGVDAKNLHATTYLIIGQNSRFEDYGIDQTGCFWIGSGFGGLKAWR